MVKRRETKFPDGRKEWTKRKAGKSETVRLGKKNECSGGTQRERASARSNELLKEDDRDEAHKPLRPLEKRKKEWGR